MDRIAAERHLKQNKEIIRINQIQSSRIAALEGEVTKLLSENIQLRTQVIQLTHKQDLSNQKAQLEKKIREIHRLVRSLGSPSAGTQSPAPTIIKKSPKKVDLFNLGLEQSPERPRLDFVNARSKSRSLSGPARVARSPERKTISHEPAQNMDRMDEITTDTGKSTGAQDTMKEGKIPKDRGRGLYPTGEESHEARRSSRRVSRANHEIVPLRTHATDNECPATGSPRRSQHPEPAPRSSIEVSERPSRRRSRSSMSFDSAPLYAGHDDLPDASKTPQKPIVPDNNDDDDDKENAPSQRRSTAAIRLLHSSPVKSRTALNLIADPLPSANIQTVVQTPAKPLNEVPEIKCEPVSPVYELQTQHSYDSNGVGGGGDGGGSKRDGVSTGAEEGEETGGRSRRGKSVNYAEPSLRHKMRRTEVLPGDKRRKSSYRRTASSSNPTSTSHADDREGGDGHDQHHSSSSSRQAITIEED